MWKVFWMAMVMSLFLVSCAGAPAPDVNTVTEVSRAATASGVMKALAGAEGTLILRDSTQRFYMLVWDVTNEGACFWLFDAKKISAISAKTTVEEILARDGQIVNIKNFNDLTNFLKEKGWNSVTAAELSIGMRQGVLVYLQNATKTLPTFIFMVVPTGFEVQDGLYNPVIQQ